MKMILPSILNVRGACFQLICRCVAVVAVLTSLPLVLCRYQQFVKRQECMPCVKIVMSSSPRILRKGIDLMLRSQTQSSSSTSSSTSCSFVYTNLDPRFSIPSGHSELLQCNNNQYLIQHSCSPGRHIWSFDSEVGSYHFVVHNLPNFLEFGCQWQ